jgi:hypothetical protein
MSEAVSPEAKWRFADVRGGGINATRYNKCVYLFSTCGYEHVDSILDPHTARAMGEWLIAAADEIEKEAER